MERGRWNVLWVIFLMTLAPAACTFSFGSDSGAEPAGANLPAIAISRASILLSYSPWQGAPSECTTPAAALKFVERSVDSGDSGCRASLVNIVTTEQKELLLFCRFDGTSSCSDIYRAQIWTQRDPYAPSGKYEVLGLASLIESCPNTSDERERGYRPSPEVLERITVSSNGIKDLLHDTCLPPPA